VFCDISKAFDRVWHDGLIHKLRRSGISANLLHWLGDYLRLTDRQQLVVLSNLQSYTVPILPGVPQGSILGPLLFLVYINDIVLDIDSSIRLFADDTALYVIVENPANAAAQLNKGLDTIHTWAEHWLVSFNPSKTESLFVWRKSDKLVHPPIFMNSVRIEEVQSHKHLCVLFSNSCSWHDHIQEIKKKGWKRLHIRRSLKFILDRKLLETIYTSFIRPILEYADVVFDNMTTSDNDDLKSIQAEGARIITGATRLVSLQNLYRETGLEPLQERRRKHNTSFFTKCILPCVLLISLLLFQHSLQSSKRRRYS